MVHKSAILAWKFPVMNGIIFEGDTLVKWEVIAHPVVPLSSEIPPWKAELDIAQLQLKKVSIDAI